MSDPKNRVTPATNIRLQEQIRGGVRPILTTTNPPVLPSGQSGTCPPSNLSQQSGPPPQTPPSK